MKKILMVIASRNFRDEEYFVPKDVFEKNGFIVTTASSMPNPSKGTLGAWAKPDILVTEAREKDYDAVVFVGGSGAREYFLSSRAHKLAREFFEAGKATAAICIAPSILANAGILKGKHAVCFPSERDNLMKKGAIISDRDVAVDGNIVTATGPAAANEFASEILKILGRNPYKENPLW
ncbi:MAG: DJ-1/PfpI family protein [Deltaproteobacteria bacterium]|nr:DJ-1/PfpI family protein [Deltaproteobacteria bacterium]